MSHLQIVQTKSQRLSQTSHEVLMGNREILGTETEKITAEEHLDSFTLLLIYKIDVGVLCSS